MEQAIHRHLRCGIELAALPLPGRSVAVMEIRMLGGYAYENPEYLGITHVLEEAITKGTAHHDGRSLNDAFDEIGASHGSCAGRETVAFSGLCLPDLLPRLIELHAEILRTPTFPEDACAVAVDLTRQALAAVDDDPQELSKKLLLLQAYGQPLGRHVLGETSTLDRIAREQVVEHWQKHFSAGRMLVTLAGAVDVDAAADLLERYFEGFGTAEDLGRGGFPLRLAPGRSHHPKELEQEQISMCFPGSAVTDADFPVERVVVGILSGGMSGRLFTEVREKQGLVYWVGAWTDQPRRSGVVHVGASSTPQNVDRTYVTLLRELDRLSEDVTQQELERAISGIVTRTLTQGEVTRSKANELIDDLFFHGHPVPTEEKLAKVQAVTVQDVQEYLKRHPRDLLSVMTLGPKELQAS